jgi:hypothetical protein
MATSVFAGSARADIDGDRFESETWRVSMKAPKNWQLTETTSYPSILLWMVRRTPDGKMLLSAEKLDASMDALAYAKATSTLLEKRGFRVRAPQLHASTGAYLIDFDNEKTFLRQALLVTNGVGYALTLSAKDTRTRSQHLRAFDYALRKIRPMRKSSKDEEAPPGSADNKDATDTDEPEAAEEKEFDDVAPEPESESGSAAEEDAP